MDGVYKQKTWNSNEVDDGRSIDTWRVVVVITMQVTAVDIRSVAEKTDSHFIKPQ